MELERRVSALMKERQWAMATLRETVLCSKASRYVSQRVRYGAQQESKRGAGLRQEARRLCQSADGRVSDGDDSFS